MRRKPASSGSKRRRQNDKRTENKQKTIRISWKTNEHTSKQTQLKPNSNRKKISLTRILSQGKYYRQLIDYVLLTVRVVTL